MCELIPPYLVTKARILALKIQSNPGSAFSINIILFDNKKIYFDRLLLCIGYNFVSPIHKKFNYLKNKKIFEVGQIIGENIMDLHSKGQIYKNQNRLDEVVNLIINEKKISYEDKVNLPILHKIKINLKSLIKKYVNII